MFISVVFLHSRILNSLKSRNTKRFTAVFTISLSCVSVKRLSDRNATTRITPLTDHTWKHYLVEQCYSYPPTHPWLLLQKNPFSSWQKNMSLFEFRQNNARNDALKTSLDTVKLHWNCVILPSGWSDLENPEGSLSPLWILKVTAVSLPPPFSPLRKEHELMAYWEYCFLSLGF